MMSQNRQAARDRNEARRDYEVNIKAELEVELMKAQEQQLALLTRLTGSNIRQGADAIGSP